MRYLVVATVVWMAVGISSAWAHCGGMAKDGCHNHKAESTRHSHIPGTCEVEYQCGPSGAGPILPKMIEVLETDYQQLQHDLATYQDMIRDLSRSNNRQADEMPGSIVYLAKHSRGKQPRFVKPILPSKRQSKHGKMLPLLKLGRLELDLPTHQSVFGRLTKQLTPLGLGLGKLSGLWRASA